MTPTNDKKEASLIHAARILDSGEKRLLLLRKKEPHVFVWLQEGSDGQEIETSISANHIEEAIRLAAKHWKKAQFSPFNCGFRYTLPERDEHGTNALFYQMTASYATSNGVYFDEDLGSNCFVQAASDEAKNLWQKLKTERRL